MRLYVETMDAVLVEVDDGGRVRFENGEWTRPTLPERRAIVYAAQNEIAALDEVIERLGSLPAA